MPTQPFRIGCGAGFSGDRADAGGPVLDALIRAGGPAALMFETLAERTLALAQLARRNDPDAGYEPQLRDILEPLLCRAVENGVRVIGNFGAANPRGAAEEILRIAERVGLGRIRVAVVEGDDLSETLDAAAIRAMAVDPALGDETIIAANAYLGAEPIARALADGADIVVTGRVADPALALGPIMHHFGWSWDDWDRLAAGTMAGHLLECGAQATGGYFADPGFKDVPDMHEIGFPIAEITVDGGIVMTKPEGTGGIVSTASITEQLLYEIHDPAGYLTPDVILDISGVSLQQVGPDRVAVNGARGRPRPPTLKATVSVDGGFTGEAEISYAGPNAARRARLAAEIVRKRLAPHGNILRQRYDIIGLASVFNDDDGKLLTREFSEHEDVRLRVAGASRDRIDAERLTREVLALYCTGPAGGGGVRRAVTPVIHTSSAYVPRERVVPRITMLESRP